MSLITGKSQEQRMRLGSTISHPNEKKPEMFEETECTDILDMGCGFQISVLASP